MYLTFIYNNYQTDQHKTSASSAADEATVNPARSFRIDSTNAQFLKDGKPFRYVGGSFHYFRALPDTWQHKLRTMRAAGLTVVTTYVEWALHNPRDGVYNWTGIADLERFIELAEQEDLLVVLRPGPYICAERDMVRRIFIRTVPFKLFYASNREAFHTGCSPNTRPSNCALWTPTICTKCKNGTMS